ncbi:MAG: efflux RND transporter permease subunit, partial [Candidatus Competibacteraceae bacterium]|nr:efflux RND transporter permease subunit [Candidatus Competibacteraceae bacterium]
RVSLFALIFSIGILVDDAIVVVENIHRHIQLGGKSLLEAIPLAVDEVGGPTILATLTVIAALLPMAFVTGLMGPYMSPIPINASMGMLISLAVAFIFTPWLAYKILRNARHQPAAATPVKNGDNNGEQGQTSFGMRLFRGLLSPFLGSAWWRFLLGIVIVTLIGASISLAYQQWVVLKMLPFDNKSEFQVIVDMPEGTPVEQTARVLGELGRYIATVPEVTDYQAYAGTAAPINFNGLVRQYYLRSEPHMGDLQVNLTDKHLRTRKSHDIARAVRDPLQAIGAKYNANVKVVEVPPGPPVMSPLVAEIYGPDYQGQIETARNVRALFAATPDIIDIDDTVEAPAERLIVHVDRVKAALLGVSQQQVAQDLYAVLHGEDVSFVHTEAVKYPAPIRLEFSPADKADLAALLALKLRARSGALVPLSELVSIERTQVENAIYHKDLLPVVFVFGDMAGTLDSPLYGMAEMATALDEQTDAPTQYLIQQPADRYSAYSLKWDGEWQITYETFRDMGIAYSVGLILIYLLVVAQFRSYLTPLIIMAPIPLTIIGVLPGHALIGAQFTATSMIGMIALAGIIVRNSILLVDFINLEVANGVPFRQALIHADAVRAKPILLTALAAMLGALFILDDPIFQGLAIS